MHKLIGLRYTMANSAAATFSRRKVRYMTYFVGIDTGGTFTDFALFDTESQRLVLHKYPSTPHDPSAATVQGLEELLDSEGIDAQRNVHLPLDEAQLERVALRLKESGVPSVAICFLHSYGNPVHERRARPIFP